MLGIAIRQDQAAGRVELDQRQYIRDQLVRFGMADCSTVTTPMTAGLRLTKPDAAQLDAEREFMANVPYASVQWARCSTSRCAHVRTSCTPSLFSVVFWRSLHARTGTPSSTMFRYLQATKDLRLVYWRAPISMPSRSSLHTATLITLALSTQGDRLAAMR